MIPREGSMEEGNSLHPLVEGQPAQSPANEAPEAVVPAETPQSEVSGTSVTPSGQSLLPETTQQLLQELVDLPGQLLPAETVHHLKNAGRETLLALYSLWQNINRAAKGDSGEKVRKHIEAE
jgi:hypothetical protein